jgi:hypothetical protein
VQGALFSFDPVDQAGHLLGNQMVDLNGDPSSAGLVDKGSGLLDGLRSAHL